jgi:hypothetical protein
MVRALKPSREGPAAPNLQPQPYLNDQQIREVLSLASELPQWKMSMRRDLDLEDGMQLRGMLQGGG